MPDEINVQIDDMPKQSINTSGAPQPIGPYVQAVRAGDLLFISGQLPLDPTTGTLVRAGVRAQTRRVIENINKKEVGDVVSILLF